jgi:mannose-6-phosphate isomerase-like protein (cupin superfamily)
MAERLEMPDGTVFTLTRSTEETGGEVVEFEIMLPPGAPSPPRHFHPRQEERWETLEGTLSVYVKDGWRELRAGESVTIPPGQAHTLRNRSTGTVRVRDVHVPALDFEDYIRRLHALAQSGKIGSPRRPSTLIHFALLMDEHETQTASQLPVRVALAGLARIGRMLGYKTG